MLPPRRDTLMRLTGLLLGIGAGAGPVCAQGDPCAAFTWHVAHELQLFAATPAALSAGATSAAAPRVELDKLYELQLGLQTQVQFALPPGKSRPTDGPY